MLKQSFVIDDATAREYLEAKYSQYQEERDQQREIEAMKIEAYLGIIPRVLTYDAHGNLLPARTSNEPT